MTSFGYRLNPHFAIKECSSCEALYTRNCSCSKGSVEDKILIPKLPENYARCARCGHPVNCPYYQGCALLREKLEEDLITYLKYFQVTSESSDDSTNVVNAPREPFVVKKDHGVNPPQIDKYCCECGEALDGIYCQRCILVCQIFQKKQEEKRIKEEQAANARYWKIFACCDDDDDYDYTITLVLSTEETENSLTLKDNPTPSSNCKTKSSSTSPKSFLEETNTFHNSLPEFENFYFDLEEISSGNTTTHSDISLSNYESFYFNDDHIKEISSGSTTTHSDIFLSEYDSFIDFTHEEFIDELAHIISPPEYDCFYFWNFPDPGELMYVLNSGIHENLSTTCVNLPVEDDYSPLLTYVVWIFLAYLTYLVIPLYLDSFGNKDTIFDPGITINRFCSLKPGLSHRCGAFKKFNTHRCHLNEWPMIINGKNTPILDVLLFHFYPP
nr:hypothetical protein [Tanacetum cinerariifolium]